MAKFAKSSDIGPGVTKLLQLASGLASPKKFGADSRLQGALTAATPSIQRGLRVGSLVKAREAQTGLQEARTQVVEATNQAANKPVNFKQILGDLDPEGRVFQNFENQLTGLGVSVSDAGDVISSDLERVADRIDYSSLDSDIGITIKNNTQTAAVVKNNAEKELERINSEMGFIPGSKDFFTANDFKVNPELAKSFPKAAQAVGQLNSLERRTKVLNNVQQQIRSRIQPEEQPLAGAEGVSAFSQKTTSIIDDISDRLNSDDPNIRKLGETARDLKRASSGEVGEKALTKGLISKLPELQKKAFSSDRSMPRLNKMLELIDTGKVTGKGGQIRAGLAGWGELLGVSEESLQGSSDAQLFQRLGRMIVGPMRLEIIGPGQVSDSEQQIMQQMGGGGGLAADAAKQLIDLYINIANDNIDLFNLTVDNASKLVPNTRIGFPRIGQRTGVTGRPVLPREATDRSNGGGLTAEEFESQLRGNR